MFPACMVIWEAVIFSYGDTNIYTKAINENSHSPSNHYQQTLH